jgi:hypothetical protein
LPTIGQVNSFTTGTYAHAVGTTEDDVKEFLLLQNPIEITFDMSGLLQTTTVKIYEKVDGTNYRLLTNQAYPTDFETSVDGMTITLLGKNRDMKITFQSGTNEAGIIDVEWNQVETIRI